MTTVEHLESVAQQLAARLRDDDPEAVARWLHAELPDPADWFRLCFALAAAVPDDRTWRHLIAWTEGSTARHRNRLIDQLTQERYGPRPRRAA